MKKNIDAPIWGERMTAAPAELNIKFCAGRDLKALPAADEELLEYDVWTNLAHAAMLLEIEVLSVEEHQGLKKCLLDLLDEFKSGDFKLDPAKEDVHINVEHYITNIKGLEAGRKIHTGRSRNDQVATDVRLYLRDQIATLVENLTSLTESILKKARVHKDVPMPGFTHYQPAMLTTVSHWLTSWSQAILRDGFMLMQALENLNFSPLGAVASFGTSWPIDREFAADLLGFDGIEENTLDCITNRGEHEARAASAISVLMNHLSIVSQDIVMLSNPYFDMIKIDETFTTGSSVMPQKRNPDFAELIRSKASVSHGILNALLGISKGLMSGYNRDTQQTKYLIMDLCRECVDIPLILSEVVDSMTFKADKMLARCETGFINSADVADWLAQNFDLPFRLCYQIVGLAVRYSEKTGKLTHDNLQKAVRDKNLDIRFTEEDAKFLNSPLDIIARKRHSGAPCAASVETMIVNQTRKAEELRNNLLKLKLKMDESRAQCFGGR